MMYKIRFRPIGVWRRDEPTEAQVELAEAIAETLGIDYPSIWSKGCYCDYIADHKKDYRKAIKSKESK